MRSTILDLNPPATVVTDSYTVDEKYAVINVDANTATITIPEGFEVGTRKLIRKVPSSYTDDSDEVTIAFSGGEEEGSGLTSIPLFGDGGNWIIEKVTSTRWEIAYGWDKGSNDNGEWTRWADGTQVCSRSFTLQFDNPSRLERLNLSFPKSFSSGPRVTMSNQSEAGGSEPEYEDIEGFLSIATPDATEIDRVGYNDSNVSFSSGDKMTIAYIAFGRWK